MKTFLNLKRINKIIVNKNFKIKIQTEFGCTAIEKDDEDIADFKKEYSEKYL